MMKVTVVIPAYNVEGTVLECLRSVLDNGYEDFEVIVVDDASTDGTKNIIGGIRDERIRYLANRSNSGASFSRNRAIRESTGRLVLLLDADSRVEKDWIKRHVMVHEEMPADIVGGGVTGIHNTLYGRCDGFCNWWTSIPHSKSCYIKQHHIPTNNMSVKKEVFARIGYFDEGLRLGGEDAEFCFRALKNGLNIYFRSDLVIYHKDRDDLDSFLRHQENWGYHAVRMRKGLGMRYACLMPGSYIAAWAYIFPLALFFTLFIVFKWLRYRPSVLLCLPMIFIGKVNFAIAVKDSFKRR